MKKFSLNAFYGASLLSLISPLAVGAPDIDLGVVLDGAYQSEARQWGMRDKGFGLGHSEILLSSNIDQNFRGQLITVLATHGGATEFELEEAFIETLSMPLGFKVKAGRLLSNVGYLNSKHLHEDAFSDRPAVYRAVFGSHYFDDGVQVSWLAPTETFIAASYEMFSGKGWDVGYSDPATVGVYTANLQIGDDVDESNSWRVGLSTMYNANGEGFVAQETSGGSHDHSSHDHGDHSHSHGPSVTGKWIHGVDMTWKWAPQGNYKQENLRATAEAWLIDDRYDEQMESIPNADDQAYGWYTELAYQFSPNWTVSGRYGEMNAVTGDVHWHVDHYHGELSQSDIQETDIALDWHGSHFGRVRTQITHEQLTEKSQTIFTVQYIMSFGAHPAHAF
ncbi:TonB-dependent receptor [Vibrio sp. 99-70-13A1]|uniref:TonB-dependent receptor n=1 Tax=Vibrio sp. 99-70-13A1 TaxID=2607601 RepID=UPI001493B0D5|nr:TonB-dependent receptor [Vibrio sp. 99-70-13A1]NOH96649.1 TonB-dependent receptor [Vibrio sp. 99-70-13A1]